ncbi:hypothetical protein [Amycolatopsis sp. WAC 04182]|uniref:hypothetical protein n=1 Tax=Amycolatopsis sp. WAC 04182 TaxID=2203198 RepID=UPI000F78369C|nr:hypothetical protein [Amycolatopsis sp. WAC 04182]
MPNKRAEGLVMARVWLPEDVWKNAGAVAEASGTDRSKAVLAFLRWYTAEPGAELPTPAERTET